MVGDQDQVGIRLWSREFVGVDVDDPLRALQAEGIVAEPQDSHRIQHHSRPVLGATATSAWPLRPRSPLIGPAASQSSSNGGENQPSGWPDFAIYVIVLIVLGEKRIFSPSETSA